MNRLLPICCTLLLLILIEGCRSLPQKANNIYPAATPKTIHKTKQAQTVTPPTQYRSFSTDTLYSLLVAEVAASRQEFETTLSNYIEQAHTTNDKSVIARAARIAQFFRAQQDTLDMGLLWLKHEPDNIEAITLVANAYLELGKPLIALDYTEKLLAYLQQTNTQESTKDGGAFLETIASFSKQSDSQTLATLIERFQQLNMTYPHLSGIKVGLSVLHQTNDTIEDAFVWVNKALAQEPTRSSAIIQEILLLQTIKKNELAISKLKGQLDKYPANSRLRLIYARLLTETDIAEAYKQFSQLSSQSPHQLDLKFSTAILATELGKTSAAKPLFNELLAANYRPNMANFYLGHIEESQNNLTSALDYYLAIEQGENFLSAQNRIARILMQQGNISESQKIFYDLRVLAPEKIEQLYVAESDLLVQYKANKEAIEILNIAIQEFPDNSNLRYNRSTVYERQDQLVLMESDLRHVLTLDPNNVHALNGLGYFLAIRTERYNEAYQLIKKALSLKPSDAAIIDSMGWVVFKMGRIDEAITHLEKAFALLPDPEVAAHLGEALWVKGKKQEAKNIWETILNTHPNSPEILETLKRLNISL